MRAHQRGAALVLQRTAHRRPGRGQRVAVRGQQVEVVALARAHDPGLHPAPQQDAVVGRLAAAARIERGPVEHDPLLGVGIEHDGVPLAQRLVRELEPVGAAMAIGRGGGGHGARAYDS